MDYNDFQILNDEEYKIIEEQYNNFRPQADHQIVAKNTIALLNNLKVLSSQASAYYNKKISNELISALPILEKTISNLQYNFHPTKAETTSNPCNIFNILKLYNQTTLNLFVLFQATDKQSLRKILSADIYSLVNAFNKILIQMENSNITFYRFM